MVLEFKNDAELEQSFLRLIEITINLRKWTKEWDEHYGSFTLGKKKFWQQKADEYLEELKTKKKIIDNATDSSDSQL